MSARPDWEAADAAVDFQGDGIVTGRRTFQKFFTQEELRTWIERVLGRRSVAAAPGIFYVFRDEAEEQSFAIGRVSRRRRAPGIDECRDLVADHEDLLAPSSRFSPSAAACPPPESSPPPRNSPARSAASPEPSRCSAGPPAPNAGTRSATTGATTCSCTSPSPRSRSAPASARSPRRFASTSRAFFGSYKSGCAAADALLFSAGDQDAVDRACRRAPVGKLLPDALYVHHTAVAHLPPLLRAYEGCARQLAGAVDGLTLVKLSRRRPRVSYLVYESFDRVAHPALQSSIVADLKGLRLRFRDYTRSANPPVLHRKERFVADDHPRRAHASRASPPARSASACSTPTRPSAPATDGSPPLPPMA